MPGQSNASKILKCVSSLSIGGEDGTPGWAVTASTFSGSSGAIASDEGPFYEGGVREDSPGDERGWGVVTRVEGETEILLGVGG